MVPITGRASSFLENLCFLKFQSLSKLKYNFFCSSFFLCLQGQPELCGSYHLLQSCLFFFVHPNLSRLVAASFSSRALLSSSASMANLSCLLVTTFSSLSFLSNSFSSPHFKLLRVASHCFSWSSVSDDHLLFFGSLSHSIFFVSYPQPLFSSVLQSLKLCLL